MTFKIYRSDGVTELTGLKSVVYTETVNAGENLKPGCVASAYIDVEVFGAQSSAPATGEALSYYQVDNGTETLIGVFYAEPSVPTKNTYKFIAYDAVSKLDKPYSERLNSIQNSFPMSIKDLVDDVCTYAGVTLGSVSWPLSTQTVQAFYADNLTCRNIIQYAAEIAGKFVRCNTSGAIIFDWYATSSYSIKPGVDTNAVAYKQDGLTYSKYASVAVDAVAVKPVGTEGAAYIYPSSLPSVSASDPNGDGNVILTNLSATDDGDGNMMLSVEAEDDNSDGNVEVTDTAVVSNTFIISGNLLLMGATQAIYDAVAQNLYNVMSALPSFRYGEVNLFVGENPFRAGQFVSVTDSQGVSFTFPVFEMKVSASGAVLRSSGNPTYAENDTGGNREIANLSASIVEFKGNVVFKSNLTDGITEISGDNIRTGTVGADRIDVENLYVDAANITGTLTIGQLPDNVATSSLSNYREQIIYKSAASGTTSMSGTTTWVTSTSNTQNAWTTRRPVYSGSYPVLFVATQRQTVEQSNGTECSCTTPVIDQTTTVIDGGHITTGTIDASIVNVTNINADEITTGTISSQNGSTELNLQTGEFTFGINGSSYGYLANGQLLFRKEGNNGDQSGALYLHPWLGTGDDGLVALISETDNNLGTLALPYFATGIVNGSGGNFDPGYVLNNGLDPDGYTQRNIFYGDTAFDGAVSFGLPYQTRQNLGAVGQPVLLWTNTSQSSLGATTLTSSQLVDDLTRYSIFIINCHQTSNSQTNPKKVVTTVCDMTDAALTDSVQFNMADVSIGSSWEIIVRQRTVTINRNAGTIDFSTGYYSNNGTSGSSYANTMVPISIYGILA